MSGAELKNRCVQDGGWLCTVFKKRFMNYIGNGCRSVLVKSNTVVLK